MATEPEPRCRYCDQRHKPRFLCDPGKRVLDAMVERGMSFNMPSIEFPDPIPAHLLGIGLRPGDALAVQLVVQAATIPVAGVIWPMLIFTGRSAHGGDLPRWLYAGSAEDMTRLAALVKEMTEMAVRAAAEGRTVQWA